MKIVIRRLVAPIALVALGATLAACGSSAHESATPVTVFSVAADPGANIPVTTPKERVVLTSAQLRSALDDLLSHHTTLIAALIHEVDHGNDTPTAALHALTTNTNSLTDAIAMIYGVDAGRAFAQLWEQHTQFFIDYAQATRDHDGDAKEEAESRLLDYQNDFASFISTATANGVGLAAVTRLLHGHVDDLTRYAQADIAGDSSDAAQILTQAVAHMRVIANAVAGAIVAQHLKTVSG
jgi:hypothetical protein